MHNVHAFDIIAYPQPILSDIEFDINVGIAILGLTDSGYPSRNYGTLVLRFTMHHQRYTAAKGNAGFTIEDITTDESPTLG
jgi:hypothetical protein